MAHPIKILFCHSDIDYIFNLSNFLNFPANLSQELKNKLEKENPRKIDFHGVSNHYEALNLLVKTNFEGQPTSGYYSNLPFSIFICEVLPTSSSSQKNDTNIWDILNQIKKLSLHSSAFLEKYDAQNNLIQETYRPSLSTIALVNPKHKTLELLEKLLSLKVSAVLPNYLSVEELTFRLEQCYQEEVCGINQVRVTSDVQKSRKGKPTTVRQMLRWQSYDAQEKSNRGVCLEQLSLEGTGINIEDYRGKIKELFPNQAKFRDISLKIVHKRSSHPG